VKSTSNLCQEFVIVRKNSGIGSLHTDNLKAQITVRKEQTKCWCGWAESVVMFLGLTTLHSMYSCRVHSIGSRQSIHFYATLTCTYLARSGKV